MHAIWKGSISFGLINIPIGLYTATRTEELKFRLLRASDLSPVNYKRVAEADGKEVPWNEIVKGYEYEEGKFIVLKDDDFKRVDVEATQTVDIVDFVNLTEINPMFFHKPYYMEPTKAGSKAYMLLREALKNTGKVGIAKVVIKTRQHLAAVKANEKGLILELMHFADELVDADELHFPTKKDFSKGEIDMAKALIQQMTQEWNPERYKDDYKSALLDLIEKKVETGGRTPKMPKVKEKKPKNVIDLVDVLRKSLSDAEKQSKKKRVARTAGKTKTKKAA
jgi:DNA end-binding protein Ku